MYLKTRQEQDEIRKAHPDGNHCDLLLHDNHACVGCHKNPNEGKNETSKDTVEQNASAFDWLLGMARGVRRGLVRPSELDAKSGYLVQVAIDYLERENDKRLAKMIGQEVGLMIAKVFGAGR